MPQSKLSCSVAVSPCEHYKSVSMCFVFIIFDVVGNAAEKPFQIKRPGAREAANPLFAVKMHKRSDYIS